MGMLMNLALLFSIFGVLQVSSSESEDVEKRTYEVSCHHKVELLAGAISKHLPVVREVVELKWLANMYSQRILELISKCGCGGEKEFEDQKCQGELITVLLALRTLITDYLEKTAFTYLTTLDNTTLYSTWALGEFRCCCNKIETCAKKFESAIVKYKESIKECKPNKCNKAISGMIPLLPGYIEMLIRTDWELKEDIRLMEELLKMKEDFLKDAKCADEKMSTAMGEVLQNLNLRNTALSSEQQIVIEADRTVFTYIETALKEMGDCNKGKEYEKEKQ